LLLLRPSVRRTAAPEVSELALELWGWFLGVPVELVRDFGEAIILCLVREWVLYVDLVRACSEDVEVAVTQAVLEK